MKPETIQNPQTLADTILAEANQYKPQIQFARRHIHANPGTGFDIADTLSYVKQELEAMGYTPQPCGKAGLTALAGGKTPGKVFLLRADMDALPIKEETDVEFASQNGNMHACGHDMHTAMLLGAARLLKNHEDEIKGTVKLMFQPAEEIFEGSKDMITAGVLESPKVDQAMMMHVMAGMPFPAGTVIVSAPGVSAPAADYFEICVRGKGCHGSMPNTGIDPIPAAAHMILGLQEMQTRELPMGERQVLTIGTINAGTAANVIPDLVSIGGSIRTFDEETRAFMKKRMTEIVQHTAEAFRCQATVRFGSGCPTLVNDKALSASTLQYARELLGTEGAFSVSQLEAASGGKSNKTAGSEDFAYVSQEVPSIMVALAAGEPEKGYVYPQHHPKLVLDEDALCPGSALYAYTAIRWLAEQ